MSRSNLSPIEVKHRINSHYHLLHNIHKNIKLDLPVDMRTLINNEAVISHKASKSLLKLGIIDYKSDTTGKVKTLWTSKQPPSLELAQSLYTTIEEELKAEETKQTKQTMDKKLNGFNNGRDTTNGIGGKDWNIKTLQTEFNFPIEMELTSINKRYYDFLLAVYNKCSTPGVRFSISSLRKIYKISSEVKSILVRNKYITITNKNITWNIDKPDHIFAIRFRQEVSDYSKSKVIIKHSGTVVSGGITNTSTLIPEHSIINPNTKKHKTNFIKPVKDSSRSKSIPVKTRPRKILSILWGFIKYSW